ncbi:4-(cytidine 5'-diphospho)-2-C-methyl-D-erythritol kinase, partial [Treponema sp. R6D11]
INKKIPLGGGLGGGSSEAAAVLIALNKLYEKNYSKEELAEIGSRYGADVPFFIYNVPSLVEGFGERITPIEYKKIGGYLTLYISNQHCSTKDVYNEFDRIGKYTKSKITNIIKALRVGDFESLTKNLTNSLQSPCFSLYAEMKSLFDTIDSPCKLLTGSGSAFFSITKNHIEPPKNEKFIAYEFVI